jgi:hypothetical protein
MKYMNEANWDRALRIVIGLALLYVGWTGTVGGALGWIFKIGGFLPLVTGIAGWCALYAVLGFSTCERAPGAA